MSSETHKVLCSICGEIKEGDFFYPDEEYYCYDCVEKLERQEDEDRQDEEFLMEYFDEEIIL
jgi:hypothetical protein